MTPRKPRPDLKDLKEQAILEAAAVVFAERGFRGTRIADIAVGAGIGKGTVYEYFSSKEDLFLRLFHWYTDQADRAMAAALDAGTDGSALGDLRRSCDALLLSGREMIEIYPLTMEFWSASTAPEFRDKLAGEFRRLYAQFRGSIAGMIRTGIEQGEIGGHVDPEALAAVLVSAIDGIFLQAWFDPEFDSVAAGRHFLEILILGMLPTDTSPKSEDLP